MASCVAAFESANFYLRIGAEAVAERFVIGCWPYELPRWPAPWASAFDLVSEVWASSRYTQAAFKDSAPVPVLHMPMAVDLPHFEPQPRASFGLSDGVFQFLFVFDWHSWPARKNPTGVVQAFRLAFPAGTEPVGLTIKMIGSESWSAEISAFKVLIDADPLRRAAPCVVAITLRRSRPFPGATMHRADCARSRRPNAGELQAVGEFAGLTRRQTKFYFSPAQGTVAMIFANYASVPIDGGRVAKIGAARHC